MDQDGPNDHFGQNDLIPNSILAFARPKWTKMVHFGPFWSREVHFGPFRSANRTLAIPDQGDVKNTPPIARQCPCHTAFSVVSQIIAATPSLLCVKMAYRKPKTGLAGGYRRKILPLKPIVL